MTTDKDSDIAGAGERGGGAPGYSTPLPSWNETPTRSALITFVEEATHEGERYVRPEDRVAVFDNDGTLWCEKPMPIELGFILEQLAAMADRDPSLRERQPWRAAHQRDYAWLDCVIAKHYSGDDSDVKTLAGGLVRAFAGWSVEDYVAAADAFVLKERHPTLGRPLRDCGYLPMVELLRYLAANGFTTYIASGGNRDFMRGFAQGIYGVSPERVIGSSSELRYQGDSHGGSVVYQAEPDVFDDGPVKPVRIWSRIGRRPILACGNSNGDVPMLQFAAGPRLGLRLLVLHDDAEREFAYTSGADVALERAKALGWTVISIKKDWARVFADEA